MATRVMIILTMILILLIAMVVFNLIVWTQTPTSDVARIDALRVRCGVQGLMIAADLMVIVALSWRIRANRLPNWPDTPP